MPRNRLQNGTAKSLAFLSHTSTQLRPSALFPRPRHIRLQQQRTFRWSGASGLHQAAQEQVKEDTRYTYTPQKAHTYTQETASKLASYYGSAKYLRGSSKYLRRARLPSRATAEWQSFERPHNYFGVPYKSVEVAQQAVSKVVSRRATPHEALSVLLRAAQCPGYLETITEPFLRSILELVSPEKVLLPFREIHQELPAAALQRFKHRTLAKIFNAYVASIELLLSSGDRPLEGLDPWKLKYLLRIAAIAGDGQRANRLFEVLSRSPSHTIDLESCNKFLQALCWSGVYHDTERFQLRVNDTALRARYLDPLGGSQLDKNMIGYQVGRGGLKDQAFSVIQQMNDLGIEPDAETWSNVVVALAREGDIEGVKSLLNRIWEVDIDAVLRQDESGLLFENRLPSDSSNLPNGETLFAVAHAFCINNDVAAALQVVDFLSRKYNIPVEENTWIELMEWTHIHSTPRHGRNKKLKEETKIGQLPLSAVKSLWDTMRSPPFNMKINSSLLRYLFKSSIRRGALIEALELMEIADKLSLESATICAKLRAQSEGSRWNDLGLELQDTRRIRDLERASSYFQDLLSSFSSKRLRLSWSRRSQRQTWWYHRTLPDLIGRYSRYSVVHGNAYSTPDGRIQFGPLKEMDAVTLKNGESPFPGVRLFQAPACVESMPLRGLTRQTRLQKRHGLRELTRSGKSPLWKPSWFERGDVKDWQPATEEVRLSSSHDLEQAENRETNVPVGETGRPRVANESN